ncbi:ribonuclease R [Geobacter hydrogenophilus]|uniref:Ribonuclease R n=1 Tax=Geobacter hydrogenophilus TaxID=40983 RepID=A0A9W6FXG4_9BACT|nr:ribonuclease R [Geobacter hydrogenophilus]MBT0895194.1 ribonuclease R [Geobacter hydrogenophilus]GLI36624.1 ribonuclease R [Geobacter hydrogenophilus]
MKRNRETVQAVIRERGGSIPFRDLMQAFGVTKGERKGFKDFVDRLVSEGHLVRFKGNRYALADGENLVTGRLSCHPDGYGFVIPEGGGDDVYIPARALAGSMHGDTVEVRVETFKAGGKKEGRIVRTVTRGQTRVVGRFEQLKGFGIVVPDETRISQQIVISQQGIGRAKGGQTVVAEITAYPTEKRRPEGRIVEVLGWSEDPEVEVRTIIVKHGLPFEFPADVLDEARAVPQAIGEKDLKGRTDLREIVTVTIDGETARDFDDAVAVRKERGGNIRLWVSIADVSHYVKPEAPLDREAYLRGTSVYFPDRCIPMLPEELSNGICSLNPRVERLTMTAEMVFTRSGTMKEAAFYPSVIRSDARLTYTIVKKILVDGDAEAIAAHHELVPHLEIMRELAQSLTEKRRKRGSIDFDLPEPQIILDLQGETIDIVQAERNLAHRIIEEFMLAANEAVASHIEAKGIPSLYRVHEPPDPAKLIDFQEFIFNFGFHFRMEEDRVEPAEIQRLLVETEGTPEERMINQVLLRCMKQARYSHENLGHFGLAARCYTHFTSPIRRYPDLVVHRILKALLAGKMTEKEIERLETTLPETAEQTSRRERVAMEAEREIVALKKAQFMREKIGEEFDGYITGVTSFGLFVELAEIFVEGMVHISTMGDDFYRYLEKQHALVGERLKETYRIGDKVRVTVAGVSIEKRQIEFVLAGLHERRPGASSPPGSEEYPRIPVTGKRPRVLEERRKQAQGGKKVDSRGSKKGGGKGGGGRGRRR